MTAATADRIVAAAERAVARRRHLGADDALDGLLGDLTEIVGERLAGAVLSESPPTTRAIDDGETGALAP